MRPLRLCVVGAGRAGLIHARNLCGCIRHAQLVALCDPNATRLRQAGTEMGVEILVEDYRAAVSRPDIEAVVIATPTFLHCEIACLAAEHGKHIFLEKPMAVTADECHRINQAVARAGVSLQIGFMRRFDASFVEAREFIRAGHLGRIMTIKSTGRGPGGPGPWMYDLRKSNGIVAEVNSHDIDSIRWLTGLEIETVFAQAWNFKCPDARADWPDFYDNVVAQFGLEQNAIGLVDGTCPAHYGYDARVEVLGENGVIFIGTPQQPGFVRIDREGHVAGHAVKTWRTLFKEAYLAELASFVDAVHQRRPVAVTGEDGLRAVEAVVAINKSIKSGTLLRLERKPSL
jgi:predicted dehydrogenase